jgi:hypothetical protein
LTQPKPANRPEHAQAALHALGAIAENLHL